MRRIWRLPFGERRLRFTPALSSFPGHAPTHEESFPAEGNVAALAPTSAMILLSRIDSLEQTPISPLHSGAAEGETRSPDPFDRSAAQRIASRRASSSPADDKEG